MGQELSLSPEKTRLSDGGSGRLHHLDALRSLAMLWGLFVHANMLHGGNFIPLVGLASIYFRMATFFLISGYLAAHMAVRTSNRAMLSGRTLSLLLPFAVMLALVAPPTSYLVLLWHEGPGLSFGDFLAKRWSWMMFLHLWFLPVLWVYVLLVPAIRWGLGLAPLRRAAAAMARWHPDMLIVVLALAAGGMAVALRGLYPTVLRPIFGDTFEWTLREMLRYLPFFALGVALQASQPLFDRFHRVSLPALALGAIFALAAGRLEAGLSPSGQTALWLFVWAALTLPIVAALLWIAQRLFAAPNPIVGALTGSIYTIYLFHYIAIYAFALLLVPALGNGVALYFTTVALAFLTTFALHQLVIAQVPLLRLLFNGRRPPKWSSGRLHHPEPLRRPPRP
jgi:glucan biosynthesis protein C